MMPEFDYFCTANEYIDLLGMSLDSGYRIQANKNLTQPTAEICETRDMVQTQFDGRQYSYFLGRGDFTRYPLKLRSIKRDGEAYWYPRSREGGPMIEMYFFAPHEKDGRRIIPCSLITYHSKIINPITSEFEPAGEATKMAFNTLVAELRKQSRRVKSNGHTAFVSLGVDEMLADGWSLAVPFAEIGGEIAQKK